MASARSHGMSATAIPKTRRLGSATSWFRDVVHGHSLQIADIDGDGNLDIFAAEMAKWTESRKDPDNPQAKAWIFFGDGQGHFRETTFSTGIGFHEARVADLNGNGRMDILDKPYNWDAPRVDVWLQEPATQTTIAASPGAESNGAADDRHGAPDKVFVGYVFQQPRKIEFSLYTHLCHAFITPREDGSVRSSQSCPSRQLVADAHQAGVKVLVSLGGWGWDKQFAAIVSQAGIARTATSKSVMTIVDEYDYDGIDLDWEYPDTKTGGRRLRAADSPTSARSSTRSGKKKGRQMFVTMAASSNPARSSGSARDFLLETMDWINVMTYDYTGDWTDYAGHHSPLFASSKQPGPPRSTELTMKYLLESAACPPTGWRWAFRSTAAASPSPSPTPSHERRRQEPRSRGGNYSNIATLMNEQGWTRQWDDETKNPWLISPDGSVVIGYDDAESVALKTDWAMKQGFRGVFFWQIRADDIADGTIPLQEAAHRKWEAASAIRSRPDFGCTGAAAIDRSCATASRCSLIFAESKTSSTDTENSGRNTQTAA